MKEFKKMILEIDLAGLATKSMLDKVWDMNQSLLINDQFDVERCKELVTKQLVQTVNQPMLEKLGLSKIQFDAKCGDMTQVVIDIVDLNRDGFIDKEEFLLIGSLISKFSQMAGGGEMDLAAISEIAGNSDLLENYWDAYDENGDNEIDREELKQLLQDFIGKFMTAITVWSGEELPENAVEGFVEDLTDRAFSLLDKDNSGKLSKEEFLQLDKVFTQLKDFKLDAQNISLWVSQKMLDDLWLQYDNNGDGILERSEVKEMVKELLVQFHGQSNVTKNAPPHVLEAQAEKLTKSLMEAVDDDDSGTLTKEEFQNLGEWLKSFMVDNEVNDSLKTAMIDELWDKYDDDQSGFLEKEEVKEVIHQMICNMEDLHGVFGKVTREETQPYLDKLWKICKTFDLTGDKKISKKEFEHFAAYINECPQEIDFVKIRFATQKRHRKYLWRTNVGKHDKKASAMDLQAVIVECLEDDGRKLPTARIAEMTDQCICNLTTTGSTKFITRKEFKEFPDWYMRCRVAHDNSHLDLNPIDSAMNLTPRSNSLERFSSIAQRHRKSFDMLSSASGVMTEMGVPGVDAGRAIGDMMEIKAKEIWENQIDEKSKLLVEHMVTFAEMQVTGEKSEEDVEEAKVTCADRLWKHVEFLLIKLGIILGIAACVVVVPILVALTALTLALSLLTACYVDDITCAFMLFTLLSFTVITVIRQLAIMILHTESGGVGLAYSIIDNIFVSTWIHEFLDHLDRKTSWFDLHKFLFYIFDFMRSIVAADLKDRSVEEFVQYVIKDEARKTYASLPGVQMMQSMHDVMSKASRESTSSKTSLEDGAFPSPANIEMALKAAGGTEYFADSPSEQTLETPSQRDLIIHIDSAATPRVNNTIFSWGENSI